jgi:hypothetical protein
MTDERINEPEERSGENVQNAAERERWKIEKRH